MNKNEIKQKVIFLRKEGKTYSEIQNILKIRIAKSTLAYWCRGVILPKNYHERVKKMVISNIERARPLALIANKRKQETLMKSLREKNLSLLTKVNKDVLKIILSMVYFCEGCKWNSHRGLIFGNTDAKLINFYITLLKICYPEHIKNDSIRCRVSYRADQDIEKLQKYWSKITGVPKKHFYKTKPDPRTAGKKTQNKNYKGVCVISCSGTRIQLELEIIAKIFFDNIKGPIV